MRNEAVTFDDVLITPKFSEVKSRKDVDLSVSLSETFKLSLPVFSANMSTITGPEMCKPMFEAGGLGILHRFCSIEDNVKMFLECKSGAGVSVGVSKEEFKRAEALYNVGASVFCIDVAHGAQQIVVDQVVRMRKKFGDDIFLIVGNFATGASITAFNKACKKTKLPDLYKVGIGPGSVCTTRMKTGVGVPQLSAIGDCARVAPVIADGGIRTPGDIAKALAQGAKAVMIGSMLAGTDETPGEVLDNTIYRDDGTIIYVDTEGPRKVYKGSAANGYGNGWKTSEGIGITIPAKGPVGPILKDIEGGLRSSFTYVGAANMEEFQQKTELLVVSHATRTENGAHIK